MSKSKSSNGTVGINVGSSKAPRIARVDQAYLDLGRAHGLPDADIGKAWLRDRAQDFAAEQTISGAHRERDVALGVYKARIAASVRRATRSERISEQVGEALDKARMLAALDPAARALLGLAPEQTEGMETEATEATEATLAQ